MPRATNPTVPLQPPVKVIESPPASSVAQTLGDKRTVAEADGPLA
jgi:hypothetical protein